MTDDERPSRSRKRKRESSKDALNAILARLNSLEQRFTASPPSESFTPQPTPQPDLPALTNSAAGDNTRDDESTAGGTPVSVTSNGDSTGRIVEAIASLVKVRSQNYFISNFDPKIHNIDVWCEEVDRAKESNGWNDNECLSRMGNCLKGDARTWLLEWSSTDRSWSSFKRDFKALCPRDIDIATILFEVMSTDSKSYVTYAEYARRSLLKLKLVRGLSDELIVAIVIRGVADPHIKAAATNAKLQSNDLVQFFSMYVKPKNESRSTRESFRASRSGDTSVASDNDARKAVTDIKCHFCGKIGHKRADCQSAKRQRTSVDSGSKNSDSPPTPLHSVKTCTFCKKNGHTVENCFAKQRSESSN